MEMHVHLNTPYVSIFLGGAVTVVGTGLAFAFQTWGFVLFLPLVLGSSVTMNTLGYLAWKMTKSVRSKSRLWVTFAGLIVLNGSLGLFIVSLAISNSSLVSAAFVGFLLTGAILSAFFRLGFRKSGLMTMMNHSSN
jgi:Na+/H+ antiporter NhaA